MTPEEIVALFRKLLNQFKQPYLSRTNAEDGNQDVSMVDEVEKNIQHLYFILKPVIASGGVANETQDITKKGVISVFEKAGILPALRQDPTLKGDLLNALETDLYMYPLTLNTALIDKFGETRVESHQKELISNKNDGSS